MFGFCQNNTNFSANNERLNSLNIVPLGGVAMAASFIPVRLLGQAGSNLSTYQFLH